MYIIYVCGVSYREGCKYHWERSQGLVSDGAAFAHANWVEWRSGDGSSSGGDRGYEKLGEASDPAAASGDEGASLSLGSKKKALHVKTVAKVRGCLVSSH